MAFLVDSGRAGWAKLFSDTYGGNPSSVIFGQPLVSHVAPDGRWQYAAWYAPSNALTLARRHVAEDVWHPITLPFGLNYSDSHNSINLGISTSDGRLHVAAGQHNDPVQYTRSYAGMLTDGFEATWTASSFEPVSGTLAGTVVGDLTYPTFTAKPDGGLLFAYRNGGSGDGELRLAEYDGTWTVAGDVSSSTGGWSGSPSRSLYWTHPVYDPNGILHLAGTWRESGQGVLCSPGMITNHHIVYVNSSDHGRTWWNGAGVQVAQTGVDPLAVSDPGIHLPSFANTYLAHQVSDLAIGPGGLVGILPDYCDPGELSGNPKCCTTMDQRFALAGQGPRWRVGGGTWGAQFVKLGGVNQRTGYPSGRKAATRGRMAFAPNGDMVIIFSGMRIYSARAATGYTDWTLDEDGANTAYAFGEVGGVDRAREDEGILSVLYMQRDGRVCVRDINLTSEA
jgi:hypothetical protein